VARPNKSVFDIALTLEAVWLDVIQGKQFNCGPLICGLAHLLSMAFLSESARYSTKA